MRLKSNVNLPQGYKLTCLRVRTTTTVPLEPQKVVIGTSVFEIPKNGRLSAEIPADERLMPPELAWGGQRYVSTRAMPIDIEPDAGMAGVVGDVVKSAKAGSTVEHFVTPKKTTELNQEYVVLKAVGLTADQITDGNASQIVQWDGGEAVPGEPLKRQVKRDATGNGPTEVKIKAKQGGTVAAQMNVWVVWCDWNPIQILVPPSVQAGTTTPQPPAQGQDFTFISHGITTTATIKPDLIITDPEHPALEGAPQSDPPGVGAIHLNDGRAIARPKYKWDISRQYRCKIITVNFDKQWALNFGTGVLTPGGGIYANIQGANATSTIVDYPQDKLDGNDDSEDETTQGGTLGENSNPYDTLPQGLADKGVLFDSDAPGHPVALNAVPPNAAELEVKLQFLQFCRLEIGSKWFRISDDHEIETVTTK